MRINSIVSRVPVFFSRTPSLMALELLSDQETCVRRVILKALASVGCVKKGSGRELELQLYRFYKASKISYQTELHKLASLFSKRQCLLQSSGTSPSKQAQSLENLILTHAARNSIPIQSPKKLRQDIRSYYNVSSRPSKRTMILAGVGLCILAGLGYYYSMGVGSNNDHGDKREWKRKDPSWKKTQRQTPKQQGSNKKDPSYGQRRSQTEDRSKNPSGDHSQNQKIILGSTYLNGNNWARKTVSALTQKNHAEYAKKWGLIHLVATRNLLENECTDPYTHQLRDCVPYWNKIAMFRNWLNATDNGRNSQQGQWRIFIDDDMVITNMGVDPVKAIEALRAASGKLDPSVLVSLDAQSWNGDVETSVNTGALFVRKDRAAKKVIEAIWERRNERLPDRDRNKCPTLGLCQTQEVLHEQQALANVIKYQPDLSSFIGIFYPRRQNEFLDFFSSRGSLERSMGVNTLYRQGSYHRSDSSHHIHYDSYDASWGKWEKGDWMGQASGVPLEGCILSQDGRDQCGFPRIWRIQELLAEVQR